mgnify:CR=1 FL=1
MTTHAGVVAVGHDEVDRPGLLEGADVVVGVVGALLIGVLAWLVVRGARAHRVALAGMEQALQEAARRERELGGTVMSLQELIFRTDTDGAAPHDAPRVPVWLQSRSVPWVGLVLSMVIAAGAAALP